jgi:hypothetical protein
MILHHASRLYSEFQIRVLFNAVNLLFESALEYHLSSVYHWQTTQDRLG